MEKYKTFAKEKLPFILLTLFSLGVFILSIRMNLFRFNNFDFGKFDLGNMTQMVWNTVHGRFMYLTDYFGTNLPRWAMSHVDPILLLFIPPFLVFQHPLTLVVSQMFILIFSSLLVYKIAELELDSRYSALFFGLAFLFYPALGYLIAWNGFHGVTAAMPFFLAAFYVFEKSYKNGTFSTARLTLFWVLLVITMSGKEEIPLFTFFLGLFIVFFRKKAKLGVSVAVVSLLWFAVAFFVIIPSNAHYRIEGYETFAKDLSLGDNVPNDVVQENYFLSRYGEFGDSYSEVALNFVFRLGDLVRVIFSGDRPENLRMTFDPMIYTPLLYPPLFVMAIPEFLINYSTTAGGIGTSEIFNHRISMIIPVLFLSAIYGVGYVSRLANDILKLRRSYLVLILSGLILAANVYTTFQFNNPVYLWLTQAVEKRLPSLIAYAKSDSEIVDRDLEIGEVVRLSELDNKDRECALKVVKMIPDGASVTGPDYLGAHLSMRETYAIFPALYNSADYVIVDVFAQKVLRILGVDKSFINDIVGKIVKSDTYKLETACGNLFVFKKIGEHETDKTLPVQEKFEYDEKVDYEILESVSLVDYEIPEKISRAENTDASFTYIRRGNNSLDDYVMFLTFANKKTGELYQVANLPSFGLMEMRDWVEDRYYVEDVDIALPKFLDPGDYEFFIGMTNHIRTRSIYLGDVEIK